MSLHTDRYRIFVGAFPTGELARRIQMIRMRYDPATALITQPHVTLAGVYWREGRATPEHERKTIAHLHAVQASIAPFELILGGVRTFPPVGQPVIYLSVEPTPELLAAHATLLSVLEPDNHSAYTPHLTLAMRLKGLAAEEVLTNLARGDWDTRQWRAPITELRLMQRGQGDRAWRIIGAFPLTGPTAG